MEKAQQGALRRPRLKGVCMRNRVIVVLAAGIAVFVARQQE